MAVLDPLVWRLAKAQDPIQLRVLGPPVRESQLSPGWFSRCPVRKEMS